MKKAVIILSVLALVAGSCGQTTKTKANTANNNIVGEQEENDSIIDEQEDPDDDCNEAEYTKEVEIPILKDTNIIIIDRSYFEKEKGIKKLCHNDWVYGIYGIDSLNTLILTSSDYFFYDDINLSFSIIAELKIYDHIRSLIIRCDTKNSMGIWLVNYVKNRKNKELDCNEYIDSYPLGYYEGAESVSWITSVIHILPVSYIDRETVGMGVEGSSRIEILKTGKFEELEAY